MSIAIAAFTFLGLSLIAAMLISDSISLARHVRAMLAANREHYAILNRMGSLSS